MKRRNNRSARQSRVNRSRRNSARPGQRRLQRQSHVFRIELLEDRSCFSVDLGFESTGESSSLPPAFEDAPVTWYFASTYAQNRSLNYLAVVADQAVLSSAFDNALDIDCLPDQALQPVQQVQQLPTNEVICDDPIVIQTRPLIATVSGNFVAFSDLLYFSSDSLTPATNQTSDLSDLSLNNGSRSLDKGEVNNLGKVAEAPPERGTNSHALELVDEKFSLFKSSTGTATRNSTAHAQPRAAIAPVNQLAIGEGEASTATEAASRPRQNDSTAKAQPEPNKNDKSDEPRTITYVSEIDAAASEAVVETERIPQTAQLQNMVKQAGKASQLAAGLDRFGWTGLLSYQVPALARSSQGELDARPQLAPIPEPVADRDSTTNSVQPVHADYPSDHWPTARPMVRRSVPLPAWKDPALPLHLASWDNSAVPALGRSDDESAAEAQAIDEAADTTHRWYLAVIPALLFIPRRRKKGAAFLKVVSANSTEVIGQE